MKDLFKNMFFVSIFNNDNKISLQQYIDGPVGQSPFCAKNGLVFAQNSMLKFKTYPGKTGPTSVAFGIENPELNKFVETMALKLNYTGFGSLEFITDEKTGLLYIIELNPRPTPTCHISGEFITNDLCDTLFKGLNLLPRKISLFKPFLIALFPGEKKRDPKSPYLFEGYHDIPLDDPILLKALDLS